MRSCQSLISQTVFVQTSCTLFHTLLFLDVHIQDDKTHLHEEVFHHDTQSPEPNPNAHKHGPLDCSLTMKRMAADQPPCHNIDPALTYQGKKISRNISQRCMKPIQSRFPDVLFSAAPYSPRSAQPLLCGPSVMTRSC